MSLNIPICEKRILESSESKITCNYNLLDNNRIVSWNSNNITLAKPDGLSNVKRIDFRNFKGDLLPFTKLKLPKLRVDVVLTGENVSEATITGTDGIYGKTKYYNITNKDGNTLLTFDKVWTYDSNEDNQLLYNIKEAVEEVNRRLNVMYYLKTYYNEFDISETYDSSYTNKIFLDADLIPINSNPGSTVLGWSKSLNKYVMTHINNSGEYEKIDLKFSLNNRMVIYAAMSYDRNVCIYICEYSDSKHGLQHCRVNTSSNDNVFTYNWNLNYNRWEDWTTRNNLFNFYPDSPSSVLGTVNNMNSVCFSPMIIRSEERSLCLIFYNINGPAQSRSIWYLDFKERAKNNIVNVLAYGDVIDKDGNTIDGLLSILAIYRDMNETSDDVYTIGYFELNKSEISGDQNNPTVLINPIATKNINASEWTDNCKLMTCGKECYEVVKADDTSITYIWFEGCYVLSYDTNNIIDFYLSEGYKYDEDTLFMFDNSSNNWVINEFKPTSSTYTSWISNIIGAKGYAVSNVSGKPILSGINPPLFIRGPENSIKGIISNPETYDTTFPDDSIGNSKYLNYSHIKNALKCETKSKLEIYTNNDSKGETWAELSMNVKGKDLSGNDIELLINNDFAIINSRNFFEFNEKGNIKHPQICLTNDAALNMALRIYTDPYYFEFTTPIDYYANSSVSIIQPIVKPVYNTINSHVLNIIETLILLHYEYNNISLVSSQFPNIDGTIFYINEDAFVWFKSIYVTDTIDNLKVYIVNNGEKMTLDTLKQLYGKLSLSVDWVQKTT